MYSDRVNSRLMGSGCATGRQRLERHELEMTSGCGNCLQDGAILVSIDDNEQHHLRNEMEKTSCHQLRGRKKSPHLTTRSTSVMTTNI